MKSARSAAVLQAAALSLLLASCQVEADKHHRIAVLVVDASGSPAEHCVVVVEGDYVLSEVGRFTDDDGIAFASAPDGAYRARATCGEGTAQDTFTVSGTDVTVTVTIEP